MIKNLTAIFILISNFSFCQNLPHPTQFNKFISKSSIEWAGYVNDAIQFKKEGLNKMLLNRFTKNEIKATLYMWGSTGDANYLRYWSKDSLDEIVFHPHGNMPMYDSLGNIIPPDPKNDRPNIDTALFTMTDITEVLYIEKGKLKSYVNWVSPMIPIITSSGLFLGNGGYFSTAFNTKYNYRANKRNKIIFLGETSRKLKLDTINTESKLKELYGRDLIETLWPYILEGKIKVISTETNTQLIPKEIDPNLLKLPVPTYDSTGGIGHYITSYLDLNPVAFSGVRIVQDWYYNYSKNIVFNKIKEMYLYLKPGYKEEDKEPLAALKIVFD